MINKLKMILLGVLCAVCLQAPVTGYAVDLPFVPVDDSETDTVTTAVTGDDTPVVTEKQTTATTSAAVTTSKPTTTSAHKAETTTTNKTASASETASSNEHFTLNTESENNDLPVIVPDGEVIETVTATAADDNEPPAVTESSDISFSDENNSSEMQTTAYSDSKDSSETSEKSNLPIIISVICGAVMIAGAVIFAIFKKGKK